MSPESSAVESTPPARGTGTLYCIPTPIGDPADACAVLPAATIDIARQLGHFVAEQARSARAFLKAIGVAHPIQAVEIRELNEHTPADAVPALLRPTLDGHDMGLLSDAGCPAIADPGAALVALAHARGIRVVPLVGPSSILLALMASGLNGQCFAFAGYLPANPQKREDKLRELERRSARTREAQLWIETPYRAQAMWDGALKVLRPDTRLTLASGMNTPDERIRTDSVDSWRRQPPRIGKTPTVFALQSVPISEPGGPRRRRAGS